MAPSLLPPPSLFNPFPRPPPSFIFQSEKQREGADLTSTRQQENNKKKKKRRNERDAKKGLKTLCVRSPLQAVCVRAREQVGL